MIPIGTIIALNSIEENAIFIDRHIVGTLLKICTRGLLIQQSHGIKQIITISALYAGSKVLRCHSSSDISMRSKTVVLNRNMLLFGPPTWWQKMVAWLNRSKYKAFYSDTGIKHFVLKKKLRGTVYTDGFFMPVHRQWLSRPLYFSKYDKTFIWKPEQMN